MKKISPMGTIGVSAVEELFIKQHLPHFSNYNSNIFVIFRQIKKYRINDYMRENGQTRPALSLYKN